MNNYPPLIIERLWELLSRFNISAADFQNTVKNGLWTPGILLGEHAEGYLKHESDALIMARANDASDEEIRTLVKHLIETRKVILADITEPLIQIMNRAL